MLMSGISAAFSALFGTPMAAAFLAMEIASIGIMYYAALVPCIWASLTAICLPKHFTLPFENLAISSDVTLNLGGSARVILLAVLCAFVSSCFAKPCTSSRPFMPDFFRTRLFAHLQAVSLLSCFRFFCAPTTTSVLA